MASRKPSFRGAFMGYHKTDVEDYLGRLESELEMYASRLAAADKTVATLRNELQNQNQRLDTLTEENYQLEITNTKLRQEAYDYDASKVDADIHQKVLEENRVLRQKAAALEENSLAVQKLEGENAMLQEQLKTLTEEYNATADLRKECENLRAEVAASEEQRKTIQDALISAQRMREIVLSEAHEEADRVTTEAKQSASRTLEDARIRNDALQASYDRMLMDTSKMKSELIELYRKHLALLAEIPGKGEVPVLEEEVLETIAQ